jgi:hypothetical protein
LLCYTIFTDNWQIACQNRLTFSSSQFFTS